MTPIEFWVSKSKVKVTVTFKLRGHTCFTNISCLLCVISYNRITSKILFSKFVTISFQQNAGARKKTNKKPSLSEVMQAGREERRQQEERKVMSPGEVVEERGADDQKEDIGSEDSDTDEEEYNMMIAGLSEVVSFRINIILLFFSHLFLCWSSLIQYTCGEIGNH